MSQIESFIVCEDSAHCINQLERFGDVAVAVSRQHVFATISERNTFCFSRANNIRNYYPALLMREDQVKTQQWDRKIQQTIEGGLIGKWLFDLKNKTKIDPDIVIRPMGMHHFYGTFVTCSLLSFGGFLTFILEIIVHHKLKDVNCYRFWRTIDWMIDSHRHMLHVKPIKNQAELLEAPI